MFFLFYGYREIQTKWWLIFNKDQPHFPITVVPVLQCRKEGRKEGKGRREGERKKGRREEGKEGRREEGRREYYHHLMKLSVEAGSAPAKWLRM